MKKLRLAPLALIVPLAALCACSGTASLSLSANWYSYTSEKAISGTSETLEYAVTFETGGTESYSVNYNDGTYVTQLSAETVTLSNGTEELCYYYRTELNISGDFTVNGETGGAFEDSVVCEVWFRNVLESLQPVKSLKTVKCHAPSSAGTTLDTACVYYDYTYETVYNTPLSKAETTYTSVSPEEKTAENSVSISSKNFFDNDQLLFVIRALDMSSSASLNTIQQFASPQKATVTLSAPTEISQQTVSFTVNGETEVTAVDAYSTSIVYSASYPGQTQTLIYAKKTDTNNNVYRNVLLYMETPLYNALGTLSYTLKSATFNDK